MDAITTDYYAKRRYREDMLASAAVDPAIARIHRALADQYRQRIDQRCPGEWA